MKTAKPVEKDNKPHPSQAKKQKLTQPVVVPLSEGEVVGSQTQKPENSTVKSGSTNRNGSIVAVHGSQTIYDQGSEMMYKNFQENLAQTGDINHPDTKNMEKDYMSTLNINQVRNYNDIKSGTYLPKNMEEQVIVHQQSKKIEETNPIVKPSDTKAASNKVDVAGTDQAQLMSDKIEAADIEEKVSPNANSNPEFTALSGKIGSTAKQQKQHESSSKASNDAQAAAPSPANERQSLAQASQVNIMGEKEAGMFKKEDFKALLSEKIHNIELPANEKEADEFEKHNNINEVNQKAVGDVKKEKNVAANDIASATAAKPDIAAQPDRKAAKMPTQNVGKAPSTPNAAKAMPVKRTAASVEQPIKEQTASIDSEMKANGVTDKMLANSNEPSFTDALDQKNKAKTQSVEATQQFRNNETKELSKTRTDAQAQAASHISGMHGARKGGLGNVHGDQKQTSAKDSQKRKEIADHINGIYVSSKADVNNILNNLDTSVAKQFDDGSKEAKRRFEDHVEKEMSAYKRRRYGETYAKHGALVTAGQWLWDKLTSLPDEVNQYFESGKKLYIKIMDGHVDKIAGHVTTQLNAAKTRIAKGKKDVQTYVDSLSPSLRKIGKDAIAEIQSKFNALEESVNSKKDALIDVLAKKYADNIASIDTRIADLKAQNSGLVNQALDVLKNSVFAIIIEIKNTLTNLLSGVISAIQAIIMDPIGFFKNLIAGVSQGFTNFGANIWTHLKTGFFGWLTGAMKGISLTMPEDVFSLKGVFSITSQVLGLTWGGIRAIGARVIGEPVMKVLETASEKGLEIVQVVRKDGAAGLWEYLKDQFADLKTTVMDAIMDIIQTQVIQAGIKFVLGLMTPVGAFIKAAMAIIDVVKFFIQRAAQIMELVKAFTDSIKAIASGNVGAVAKSIENALGRAIPVLIGFLASLLNLGGLADKILGVIRKIRQRIENAIVKFWNFIKGKAAKLLSKTGIGKLGKKKEKVDDKHIKNMDSEIAPEPFTMNGEKHTLTFEKRKIYMASEKKLLSAKLTSAAKYAKDNPSAEEFNGKGEDVRNDINKLKAETQNAENELDEAEKMQDNQSDKAKEIEDAQKKLDNLAISISRFGRKYRLIDLADGTDLQNIGDHGLVVGLHNIPKDGKPRQSHHVPEKELRNAIVNLYKKVGQTLNKNPSYEDLGEKFTKRAVSITSKFNKAGDKLPAILIHEKTHKVGGDMGVHNEKLQEKALRKIEETTQNSGGYRVVIFDNAKGRLVASFRKHHFEGFVEKVHNIIKSGKSEMEIIKESETGIIVKSDKHTSEATRLIAKNINTEINDYIVNFGVVDQDKIEEHKEKILIRINETAKLSFEYSLDNSLDVLKAALEEHKELEGDQKTREEALKKVKRLSKEIWENHVIKEIK
ncbi:phage tail protein [Chryseobacterium scophthalmum]|uniref:phage tail protein n=1 Tax=Chryseobacterium scophthalmum TaxID=59733 RepID=UPI001AEC37DC|nr:hypothetical protein [Chryseobacterium scophthalmum]